MARAARSRTALPALALVSVVAVVGSAMTLALAARRAGAERDARAAEAQAEAAHLVNDIDRSLSQRLAQLDVAVSFIETAWPLSPANYHDLLANYRLGTDVADLSLAVVVEAVAPGDVAAIEARERVSTPGFAVKRLLPGREEAGLIVVMRMPIDPGRDDPMLLGVDVAPILAELGLPLARLDNPRLWLQPIGKGVDLVSRLVGPHEFSISSRSFASADLLAVERMQSRSGELIGWFIVPVHTADLLDTSENDGYVVGIELLGDDESPVLRNGNVDAGDAPILTATIAPQGTRWRVTVRHAKAPEAVAAFDRPLMIKGLLSTVAICVLVLAIYLVRRRERGLRSELDRTTQLVTTDYLTGVLNRDGLERAMRELLNASDRTTVYTFLLDVDRFKLVNDTEGHHIGDRVLQEVALRLRSIVDGVGHLARFGGDEFVIVTDRLAGVDEAQELAERLHHTFERPLLLDGGEFLVSLSAGISIAHRDADASPMTLLRDADAAMYHAKRDPTRRSAVFDETMRNKALRTIEIERELRVALRHGQIVPYFQPLFSATGELQAFEALARWEHPERGLLRPAEFLDVAAESGCLVELNRQMLRRSCQQGVEWLHSFESTPVRVLVNLAEQLLVAPAFLEDMKAILDETGFPAANLTLEISEDTALSRLSPNLGELRALSDLGVKLAIDDFGRGRSSLLALSDLDMVTVLKLDRAFVTKLPTHEPTRTVFRAVREIAHRFGMVVVGEGVETETEADELRRLGVDCLQGYLLGHPEPAAAATARLAASAASLSPSVSAHVHDRAAAQSAQQ